MEIEGPYSLQEAQVLVLVEVVKDYDTNPTVAKNFDRAFNEETICISTNEDLSISYLHADTKCKLFQNANSPSPQSYQDSTLQTALFYR